MDGVTFFFDFEPELMIWIQKFLGDAAYYIGAAMSELGNQTLMICMLGFIYWSFDKELGKRIGVSIVTAIAINPLVKNIVLRRRPYMDHAAIKCLQAPTDSNYDNFDIAAQGYSFPSGHSTNSSNVFCFLALEKRKKVLTAIAVGLPILVGLSRIILGVHYPTDVIFGWVMGYGVAFLIYFLQKKIKRQWIVHLIIFAVSLVGIIYCRTDDYFTAIGVMAGLFLVIPFEERFVKFEDTRKPLFMVLRVVGGFAGFALLSWLFKLPFTEEFLKSGTAMAYLTRSVRYFLIVFILLGVYPMLFRVVEKRKAS